MARRGPRAAPAAPPAPVLAVSRYTLCGHESCRRGSDELLRAMRRVATRMELKLSIEPTLTLCNGDCSQGPYLGMPTLGLFYSGLQRGDVAVILKETSLAGRLVFDRLRLSALEVIDPRLIFDWKEQVLVAIEPDYCPVSLAAYLMDFNARESCGKCFPCRHGVHRLHNGLKALMAGEAKEADLAMMGSVAEAMSQSSYCQFAAKVATPVLMGLSRAGEAFDDHLQSGCRAEEKHL